MRKVEMSSFSFAQDAELLRSCIFAQKDDELGKE
jgi:hypothetical protein